jgi:hypothetical protein
MPLLERMFCAKQFAAVLARLGRVATRSPAARPAARRRRVARGLEHRAAGGFAITATIVPSGRMMAPAALAAVTALVHHGSQNKRSSAALSHQIHHFDMPGHGRLLQDPPDRVKRSGFQRIGGRIEIDMARGL